MSTAGNRLRVAGEPYVVDADGPHQPALAAAHRADRAPVVLQRVAGERPRPGLRRRLPPRLRGRADRAIGPRVLATDRVTGADDVRRLLAGPDVIVGSVAALAETGSLVIASGSGGQLPGYAGGAAHAIGSSGRRRWYLTWSPRCGGSRATACRWKAPAHRRPTGGPAPSTASSSSTRNTALDAAPSCCCAKPSDSEPGGRSHAAQGRGEPRAQPRRAVAEGRPRPSPPGGPGAAEQPRGLSGRRPRRSREWPGCSSGPADPRSRGCSWARGRQGRGCRRRT